MLLFSGKFEQLYNSKVIIRFADDTTVRLRLIKNNESAYTEEVNHLTSWCSDRDHCGLQEEGRWFEGGCGACLQLQVSGGPHLWRSLLDCEHLHPTQEGTPASSWGDLRKTTFPLRKVPFYRCIIESILTITARNGHCSISSQKSLQRVV